MWVTGPITARPTAHLFHADKVTGLNTACPTACLAHADKVTGPITACPTAHLSHAHKVTGPITARPAAYLSHADKWLGQLQLVPPLIYPMLIKWLDQSQLATQCGGSVSYYPIPGDNSNEGSPVEVALSRHFACFSGIEAHSYLLSSNRSTMFLGTVSSSPVGVCDSRRKSDYSMAMRYEQVPVAIWLWLSTGQKSLLWVTVC